MKAPTLQILTAALGIHVLGASSFAFDPPQPWASNAAPRHPSSYAATMETQRTVTLRLVVDRDGTVRDPRVVDGAEPYASAALKAAERWRYEPARENGRAIATSWEIRVHFELPEKAPDRFWSSRQEPAAGRTSPVVAAR